MLLEEYYSAVRAKLQLQLIYNFKQGDKDVSDIIRGKIQILDEFLSMKTMFTNFDKLEKDVKDEEERLKKVKGA